MSAHPGRPHKWVRNGRFADPELNYSSPVCLICGAPDPKLPHVVDSSDTWWEQRVALLSIRDLAKELVDRWQRGVVTRSEHEVIAALDELLPKTEGWQ